VEDVVRFIADQDAETRFLVLAPLQKQKEMGKKKLQILVQQGFSSNHAEW
jgi:prephenate dehydratase